MKHGYVYSCLLGGAFFTVPYLALGIGAIPSVAIGIAAYGAGLLIFRDRKKLDLTDNFTIDNMQSLNKAKELVNLMKDISTKLENIQIIKDTKSICETSNKIIETIEKKPEKLKKAKNFLNYYLPATIKVLQRYDEIENQKLTTSESKMFMKSVEDMVSKIKVAFEQQLSNIYQTEMVDTDAELKVFETMLKSDGFLENIDFNIKK